MYAAIIALQRQQAVRGIVAVPVASGSPAGTSFGPDGSLAFLPGGRRYDVGVANLPGLAGFRAGLELVLAAGIEHIADQSRRLTARVVEGLGSRDIETLTPETADQRAGVVAALVGDPLGLRAFLRDQSVDVWTWERDGRLRVDCHGFNTDDDIDRLLDALDAFRVRGGRLARAQAQEDGGSRP